MYKHRKRFLPKHRRTFVRIYGRFMSLTGKVRGYEYQVRIREGMNKQILYRLIRHACGKMKYEHSLPYHKRRETFPSFHALFSAPWIRIRKVLDYDIQMDYPTPFDYRRR